MRVAITGTRGIPAQHGGFETFAEMLALHLAKIGWEVSVYCQEYGSGPVWEDTWQGVRRVHVPVARSGAFGTIVFDWVSTLHSTREGGMALTLGYNTACFSVIYRIRGVKNVINMDGIEWRRDKWSLAERAWLWINERIGCWAGNHLVADHPEIAAHLRTRVTKRKITMIPYGARYLEFVDPVMLGMFGLGSREYALVIARPEPENSILEIVQAFSMRRRGHKLVVLGKYDRTASEYHRLVMDAASPEVLFVGAIYEKDILDTLRFHARLYVHGHTVGGTNPSLVEALGAGTPVLAHDNRFNRWVAGEGAAFFVDRAECSSRFDELLDDEKRLQEMGQFSRNRYHQEFEWPKILDAYASLMEEIGG